MGFFDFLKRNEITEMKSAPYYVWDVVSCIISDPCCKNASYKELCCILWWVQAEFLVSFNKKCFSNKIVTSSRSLEIPGLACCFSADFCGIYRFRETAGNCDKISSEDQNKILDVVREVRRCYRDADQMMSTIIDTVPYRNAYSGDRVISDLDLKKYYERYEKEDEQRKESKLQAALYQFNINISPIKDGEFKSKLCRMYDAINNVLIATEENPTKEKDVRRLTEYYIPTMVKLLGKYSRLSEPGRKTPEVEKTIRDIEALPDEIIEVANAVYDDIMEENIIDINADISVLKQKAESDKGINEFERKFTEVKECEDGPDYKRLKQVNLHICLFEWRMNEITPDETKEEYAFVADVQEYWWFDFNENRWRKCFKEDIDDLRMNKFWRTKVC